MKAAVYYNIDDIRVEDMSHPNPRSERACTKKGEDPYPILTFLVYVQILACAEF